MPDSCSTSPRRTGGACSCGASSGVNAGDASYDAVVSGQEALLDVRQAAALYHLYEEQRRQVVRTDLGVWKTA